MNKIIPVLLIICVVAAMGGCADEGERGFRTSPPQFMAEVEKALIKEGIPFRKDADGFIRYRSSDDAAVSRIRVAVDRALFGGVAVKFRSRETMDYLKELLSSQGLEHRIEARADGEWIRWYPQSESQQAEIELKVAQHKSALQRRSAAAD